MKNHALYALMNDKIKQVIVFLSLHHYVNYIVHDSQPTTLP